MLGAAHPHTHCNKSYIVLWLAGIEDLREKREELNRSILRDEEEKAKIQKVHTASR